MIFTLILLLAKLSHVSTVCVSLSDLQSDVYLSNSLLGVTTAVNVYDCAASCQSHHGCQSFGFEPGSNTCHLHTAESSTSTANMVPKNTWLHGDLSIFPQELWGPCANHGCAAGQRCRVNRFTKSSVCVPAVLSLPDDHCPALEVTNAVSSGGQTVGSTRNYTCLEGYRNTESDLPSALTTCLSGNTWSPINLICIGPFIKKTMSGQPTYNFEPLENTIYGSTSSIIFWVKTCHDSNFGLCKTNALSFGECFEVVIGGGGNTLCSIRLQIDAGILNKTIISNVVSCTEHRPFWVSWSNDKIRIGKGSILGNQVIVETDNQVNIESVWYSCFINNEAEWLFLKQG